MSDANNIQIVEQVGAALNAHDLDRYMEFIDDSYTGETEFGAVAGPAAQRQQVEIFFEAFPDLRVETEGILVSGDHVVARVRYTGTHKGNFRGLAATNKPINIQACVVIEMRSGKIIRSMYYSQNAKLLSQLGVLSLPTAAAAG